MIEPVARHYLDEALKVLRGLKKQADSALAQVTDAEIFERLDPESNSIAVIVKHLAGNSRSRWTDFLTSDGEKPDRNRDREFEIEPRDTRARLTAALTLLRTKRDANPPKKHGNIPL